MSKQVRFRRGTTTQHATFTGAEAEITVDTTKNQVVVHDGATAGGVPLLREDRPRGYTKMEFITSNNYQWTQTGKTDLKRIRVTAYGGGGGGSNSGAAQNGGAGGSGGIGMVTLEATQLSTNINCTIGAGGSVNNAGGNTAFGPWITATGGSGGASTANGGTGGTATGTPTNVVYVLGGQGGAVNMSFPNNGGFPSPGHGTNNPNFPQMATGGGIGGGAYGTAANGYFGGGGGGAAAGAQGCIIVEEIYGLY
jgi:hypothetical protein